MTPLEQSRTREANLAKGLRELARLHGIIFREPLGINSNGEFSLVVSNGTPRDSSIDPTGQYGVKLAEIIGRFHPRTGYAPANSIDPSNGWCYMNHFDVERMLESVSLT